VIQVDVGEGLWIVENIFQKSYAVQTHKHTGPVYAYTTRGAWKYREYDYVNRAGSTETCSRCGWPSTNTPCA
jgi:hypothetical protein